MLGARDNQRNFLSPAPIDFAYDFNRDADVDADDMEIGAIDDEDDDWEDDDEIGAYGRGTSRKIARLKQVRERLQMKLATAKRPRRRSKIQRRIDKVNRKIAKAEAKLVRKVTKAVGKGKMSPGEAAALGAAAGVAVGAAGVGMLGISTGPRPSQFADRPGPSGTTLGYGRDQYGAFPGVSSPMAYLNQVQRGPPSGEEIRIPLLVQGSPVAGVTIA
ncbi:hypothetical protein LCGC14_2435360, partial [marine sediment metagenome]